MLIIATTIEVITVITTMISTFDLLFVTIKKKIKEHSISEDLRGQSRIKEIREKSKIEEIR